MVQQKRLVCFFLPFLPCLPGLPRVSGFYVQNDGVTHMSHREIHSNSHRMLLQHPLFSRKHHMLYSHHQVFCRRGLRVPYVGQRVTSQFHLQEVLFPHCRWDISVLPAEISSQCIADRRCADMEAFVVL